MNAFTQPTRATLGKRALALMFVLAVALAGIAAMVLASAPAQATPITGKTVFVCVKGEQTVYVLAGRAAAQVFRQQGYTCVPERVYIRRL